MIQIYLKLAIRNLLKRKAYTVINVLGLSIGIVCFLLIMEYIVFERSYDSFHEKVGEIYRVGFNWGEKDYNGENTSIYASNVPAMGPALVEEVPDIEAYTRFFSVLTAKPYSILTYHQNNTIKFSANVDDGFYADPNFLIFFLSLFSLEDLTPYRNQTQLY